LVVKHAGHTATHRSAKNSFSFVAFYADCRHHVQPVRSGYRIVLTYNLLVDGDTAAPATGEVPPESAGELARCLDEHFATPVPGRAGSGNVDPPNRLVYLLDHEYTARGLSWARFKGSDARRAALLRAAAERADCDIVLALADIHETWSALEAGWDQPWYGRQRYRRWDSWEDGDPDDQEIGAAGDGPADPDECELQELIESSVQLDCWIEPSRAQAEPVSLAVADDEVCQTIKSVDLEPYSSEYEGYMGNYGNTVDRWYRRAALVLWPRRRAFAARAEASPGWALDTLAARARSGDVTGAQAEAATLAPFWKTAVSGQQQRGFLAKALRVAYALDEPATAAMLLAPFWVEMLTRGHATALAQLTERYGDRWTAEVVTAWSARVYSWAPGGQDRPAWLASLPSLCEALQGVGGSGTSAARLLVEDSWRWLSEEIGQRRALLVSPSRRDQALGELGRPIANVLESAAVIGTDELRDEAVGFLCQYNDDLIGCLMAALRSAGPFPSAKRTTSGLDAIAGHCARQLQVRLARPPRAEDDWSIEFPKGCSCELCDTLGGFLGDATRHTLEWPLRQDGRRHIHTRIDMAELPVRHQTRRTGRPYTLVLTKTDALFERERSARRRDNADMKWLISSGWDTSRPVGKTAHGKQDAAER
jgi:hypothetical protein